MLNCRTIHQALYPSPTQIYDALLSAAPTTLVANIFIVERSRSAAGFLNIWFPSCRKISEFQITP